MCEKGGAQKSGKRKLLKQMVLMSHLFIFLPGFLLINFQLSAPEFLCLRKFLDLHSLLCPPLGQAGSALECRLLPPQNHHHHMVQIGHIGLNQRWTAVGLQLHQFLHTSGGIPLGYLSYTVSWSFLIGLCSSFMNVLVNKHSKIYHQNNRQTFRKEGKNYYLKIHALPKKIN